MELGEYLFASSSKNRKTDGAGDSESMPSESNTSKSRRPRIDFYESTCKYTPLHDIESFLWTQTYLVLDRRVVGDDRDKAAVEKQKEFVRKLFSELHARQLVLLAPERFAEDLANCLPPSTRKIGGLIGLAFIDLSHAYREAGDYTNYDFETEVPKLHRQVRHYLRDIITMLHEEDVQVTYWARAK